MSEQSTGGTPQWAEDTPTTRTAGGVYPVPGSWVLGVADGDGAIWRRYPSLATDDDERGRDIETDEALPSPETIVTLAIDAYEVGSGFGSELAPEYYLEVEGREVFAVRDAHHAEVYGIIVNVLRAIDGGAEFEEIEDLRPETGETVADPQEEQREEIKRRREENAGLGDFA
jgi:hypothetical protein